MDFSWAENQKYTAAASKVMMAATKRTTAITFAGSKLKILRKNRFTRYLDIIRV